MKKIILASILILSFFLKIQSQINCGGILPDTGSNSNAAIPPNCTNSSADYSNKYNRQSTYIPTQGDPVVTLKVVLHIFCKSDSSGPYVNDPAIAYDSVGPKGAGLATIQYHLGGMFRFPTLNPANYPSGTYYPFPNGVDYDDRWSDPRRANYVISGLNPGHTTKYDSKIRYEVVNIYFYYSTTLVNTNGYSTSGQPFINAIAAANVSRFEEGLPVILKPTVFPLSPDLNGWPFQSSIFYPSSPYHLSPFVYCCINPWVPVGFAGTLRHEMGHAFGLMHPYYGAICNNGASCGYPTCPPAPTPETPGGPSGSINCSHPDFLSDLFPTDSANAASYSFPYPNNCPNPPLNTICYANWENTNNFTNNIMSDDTFQSQYRTWMSPLQMGRRIRSLHLNNVRRYVKDLTVDPNSTPWIVANNTSEIWDFNIQFYKNIIVKKGSKLTIKCKVAMPIHGKILVEDSAQLIIDGGEITTWCKSGLWAGIEVSGTSALGQLYNNSTGFAKNHGVVRIINGGKITKAENAIKNYITDANGNIIWSKTGGVIIGNGGIFENNTRDVEFINYQSSFGNDASYFINCDFKTTVSTPPFPFAHVTMWAVRGIQFRGCNFEYTPSSFPRRGVGILSMDAEFYIDQQNSTKTTFKHLNRGVSVLNSNPLKLAFIKNTVFDENWLDGAYFKNMNFVQFEKNELMPPVTTLGNGLYLYTCQNYKVKLNEFHEKSYNPWGSIANGLYAYKSLGGAHEVYKNQFYDLGIGVNAMDKNSSDLISFDDGLKINCNDFSQSANIVDVALTHTFGLQPPTVAGIQGVMATSDPKLPVRNIYGANCNNGKNQWYTHQSASKQIYHGSNTQAYTRPIPQPSCSDNLIVNEANTGIPLNYSLDCKDYPESNGGTFTNGSEALDNLNSYLVDRFNRNNNNDQYFEIQSTLASKINLFLTDSIVASNDSVIAILLNFGNYIEDSDLQLVFAYLHNGDYGETQTAINNLDSTRSDWADLLDFMLDIEQDSMKYYRLLLDTNAVDFLEGYAFESDKDGQSIAQAILTYILGYSFEEPRTYIEAGGGERRRNQVGHDFAEDQRNKNTIIIHPNPTNNLVEISSEISINGTIEVSDLLGRVVLSKNVIMDSKAQLSLEGLNNGVYLIRIFDSNSGIIFKEKLVKQE